MYSSIYFKLNQINVLLKSMQTNRQFRLSIKSGTTSKNKLRNKSNRELKTAEECRKIGTSYKQFRIPQNNPPTQESKSSPILHQQGSSLQESQINLLTQSIRKLKDSKTSRETAEPKLYIKQNKETQDHLRETKQQTNNRWSSFSRRNVHLLSKKMKNIRLSNYASNRNQQIVNIPILENQKLSNLLESFVCKSLQPHLIGSQKQSLKNNYFNRQLQNQYLQTANYSCQNKYKNQSNLIVSKSKVKIQKQKPRSSMSNQFHTKIKKKCLQNNPHILASIIKRKHQTLSKQDLYQFVQKMIHKSKNHR